MFLKLWVLSPCVLNRDPMCAGPNTMLPVTSQCLIVRPWRALLRLPKPAALFVGPCMHHGSDFQFAGATSSLARNSFLSFLWGVLGLAEANRVGLWARLPGPPIKALWCYCKHHVVTHQGGQGGSWH